MEKLTTLELIFLCVAVNGALESGAPPLFGTIEHKLHVELKARQDIARAVFELANLIPELRKDIMELFFNVNKN